MQIYRSVLLNNGSRTSEQHDTPISAPPPVSSDVESLLYHEDIPVDSRGDIIMFYNKVFIGFIKDFVLKFSSIEESIEQVLHYRTCDSLAFQARLSHSIV